MRINALILLYLGIFIKLSSLFTTVSAQQGFDYGKSKTQNELINIDYLHEKGYTGEGVTIGVLDAGFKHMKDSSFFDGLYTNNQVKATWDFWADTSYVYHKSQHGTATTTDIALKKEGKYVGTAPDANLLLAITDDIDTETHQDERNWGLAMEWADSLGVDIISSSLSYYDFDDGHEDYTPQDMDGESTIVAKAANRAANRGILVVNSAGNGNRTYSPCNVDSVLCVGGTDSLKNYAFGASTGPTSDGRIKPDVATQIVDLWSVIADSLYQLDFAGTSASAPMISGLAACLMEAHPNKTHMEIMRAIEQSGHKADNPDNQIGHGVPNARIADSILSNSSSQPEKEILVDLKSFPNPFSNQLIVKQGDNQDGLDVRTVTLFSCIGKPLRRSENFSQKIKWNVNDLKDGVYFLQITTKNQRVFTRKLIKK